MSEHHEPHEQWQGAGPGPGWLPPPTPFGAAAPALDQANPWQDHSGQWHYPYGTGPTGQAPQQGGYVPTHVADAHPPQQPVIVEERELLPVGPPVYARPAAPVRDPQRTALAGVIAFISVVIALWAILGFVHSMAETLSSVSSGNDKLSAQLKVANTGLNDLATKTASVKQMQTDTKVLRTELENIDGSMADMLKGVAVIGTEMSAMNTSLGTLDGEIGKVNEINGAMANDLGEINAGLGQQHDQVATMRRDVVGTSAALKTLPPKLGAVNARLTHINKVICYMGSQGILSNLKVHIKVPLIGEIGTAEVFATVVPPGSWRC